MKQTGNILGIVVAWLLSIVLVMLLLVTPVATSALSLTNANTITNVVIDILKSAAEQIQDENTAAGYQLNKLSSQTASQEDSKTSGGVAELLEKYLGVPIGAAEVEKVMSTKTVKEILATYTGDLVGVLTGEQEISTLDAEKLKTIVNNNIDEVVQIVQELKPDLTEKEKEALKSDIMKAIDEKAEEIIQALPKPEQIKEQIMEDAPEIGTALKILEKKRTIELTLIGVIAVLSALIFLCRLEGFRGFRWLAVDMFIGGGFNGLVCIGLMSGASAVMNALAGDSMGSVVGAVLSAFSKALLVRTIIILAVGGALLAAYIVIKKMRAQKAAANLEE